MPTNLDRRAFLALVTALTGAWRPPAARAREAPRTRLILLGTGGGPRPRKLRSAPAQVIVANGTAYGKGFAGAVMCLAIGAMWVWLEFTGSSRTSGGRKDRS
jgi:hypothetical protein